MDAGNIREGDYAGIGVLQKQIWISRCHQKSGEYALVLQKCGKTRRRRENGVIIVIAWSRWNVRIMKIQSESVELKIICDFRDGKDVAYFTGKVMDSGRSLGNHFLWYIHLNISWDIVLPLHTFQQKGDRRDSRFYQF